MIDVLGYKAGPLKRRLKAEYRPSWAMMPAGEAIVFGSETIRRMKPTGF